MPPEPQTQVIAPGPGLGPIAVIDGFATHPDHWRTQAMGPGYDWRGDFYPGRRRHADRAYFSDIGTRLGTVMQTVFGCRRALKVDRALYSVVSTDGQDLALAQRIPHIDDSSPHAFALVHYLSRGSFGGTAFYRHRETGLAQIPEGRRGEYLAALDHGFSRHGELEGGYIDGSTEMFEQLCTVPFVFNRAVIYHGNLLHCPVVPATIDHPDDPATGRLTIAAFFRAS